MSILTTVLCIITSKDVTACSIETIRQLILQVSSPLKHICSELCHLTDCLETDSSHTSGITNTTVNNSDTGHTTTVFTDCTDGCFCDSTITITIDDDLRSGGITLTCRNNSDRDDTTIDDDRLSNSTFTRIQFDLGGRCIVRTLRSHRYGLDRSSYASSSGTTRSFATRDGNCGLRGVVLSRRIDQDAANYAVSDNSSSSCAKSAATHNGHKRRRLITRTAISNFNLIE